MLRLCYGFLSQDRKREGPDGDERKPAAMGVQGEFWTPGV